jgi:hypothetical protein
MTDSTAVAIPEELPNPITGELVRTNDLAAIGRTLQQIRDKKRELDDFVAVFTNAAYELAAQQGQRTFHLGQMTVEIGAETQTDWDVELLSRELGLAGLPQQRLDQLITATVSYKVNANIAKQIAGSSKRYADIIERAKLTIPKRRYAGVTS